jgi:hypothetical protein
MNEYVQSVSEAAVGAVNYVKYSPLRRKHFAKLCDDMEAEHTALL